jgi:hypothetical protein
LDGESSSQVLGDRIHYFVMPPPERAWFDPHLTAR